MNINLFCDIKFINIYVVAFCKYLEDNVEKVVINSYLLKDEKKVL